MADNGDLENLAKSRFGDIPIEITISVGTARPRVRDLLSLDQEAVLPLDRAIDDPVELYVGDRLIGRGQLEEIDGEGEGSGKLGVRIVEVAPPPPNED